MVKTALQIFRKWYYSSDQKRIFTYKAEQIILNLIKKAQEDAIEQTIQSVSNLSNYKDWRDIIDAEELPALKEDLLKQIERDKI